MTEQRWGRGAAALVLLACLTACGGAATVDDLARASGGVDDTARLKSAFKAANGGNASVGKEVATQFQQRPGVISTIMARADPAVDLACDAFEASRTVVEARAGVNWVRGQQTLNQMREQVSSGQVAAQTVTFACKVQQALAEW